VPKNKRSLPAAALIKQKR